MDWDKLCRALQTQNWVILVVLGGASFFIMSPAFTLGVLAGGLLIIANFSALQHTIRCGFTPQGGMHVGRGSIIMKFYLRMLAMGVLMYLLITKGLVDPVGLAVGLSVVVISIFSLGLRVMRKISSGEVI